MTKEEAVLELEELIATCAACEKVHKLSKLRNELGSRNKVGRTVLNVHDRLERLRQKLRAETTDWKIK